MIDIDFTHPPFSLLDEAERERVLGGLDIAYYGRDDVILDAGQSGEFVFVIHKGEVAELDPAEGPAGGRIGPPASPREFRGCFLPAELAPGSATHSRVSFRAGIVRGHRRMVAGKVPRGGLARGGLARGGLARGDLAPGDLAPGNLT